jgi:putative spermidine/putrescine transport system substrate-binding protein
MPTERGFVLAGFQDSLSRRKLMASVGAAIAAPAAAPFVLRKSRADTPLSVSTYGGLFEETLALEIFPGFTAETGIAVDSVSQSGGDAWFQSLQMNQNNGTPQVDVTMCGWQAAESWQDIFQPIDLGKVSHSASVPDYLIHENQQGEAVAIGVLAWFSTFLTNTDAFPEAPVSWKDAWAPKFNKTMGWNGDIESNYLLDIVAHTFFDGSEQLQTDDGLAACFNKLGELKASVALWYKDEAQFEIKLQSGELTAGQLYHDVTQVMASNGFPVRSTFPKEGGVIDYGSWAILKGSAMKEQAEAFIDYCLRPDVQSEITRHLRTAPVIPKALTNLSDAEFSAASSEIPPIVPAYALYQTKSELINDRWQKLLPGLN